MCCPDRPHTGVPPHLEYWGCMCGSHTLTGMLGLSGSEQNANMEREVRGSQRLVPVLSVSWLVFLVWFGFALYCISQSLAALLKCCVFLLSQILNRQYYSLFS